MQHNFIHGETPCLEQVIIALSEAEKRRRSAATAAAQRATPTVAHVQNTKKPKDAQPARKKSQQRNLARFAISKGPRAIPPP